MYKTCNVVMLPINEKAGSIILSHTNELFISENGNPFDILGGYNKPKHLYITSDEEIKERWFGIAYKQDVSGTTDKNDNVLTKGSIFKHFYTTNNWYDNAKIVISSTDSTLNLPQPSQQFIQQYIEEYNKGNVIKSVLVEYSLL